jgi:hypothetical protein
VLWAWSPIECTVVNQAVESYSVDAVVVQINAEMVDVIRSRNHGRSRLVLSINDTPAGLEVEV